MKYDRKSVFLPLIWEAHKSQCWAQREADQREALKGDTYDFKLGLFCIWNADNMASDKYVLNVCLEKVKHNIKKKI